VLVFAYTMGLRKFTLEREGEKKEKKRTSTICKKRLHKYAGNEKERKKKGGKRRTKGYFLSLLTAWLYCMLCCRGEKERKRKGGEEKR